MNNNELTERMASLEAQLMHIEVALDEITRTLLAQEAQQKLQAEAIKRLENLVKGMAGSNMADPDKEPPPPHY